MKIKLVDIILEGASPEELAMAMNSILFSPDKTLEQWMQGSAWRAKQWNGSIIRCDNVEVHLEDLVKAKIIEILPDDYEMTDQCKDCYWNETECAPDCDPCEGFMTEAEYNEKKQSGWFDEEED